MAKRKIIPTETTPEKKPKTDTPEKAKVSFEKKSKNPLKDKKGAPKTFTKKQAPNQLTEKPEDWNVFKKEKKDLKLKRKQGKDGYEVIIEAKKIGERLRCKTLKGGEIERNKLINDLHSLLKGGDHYPKFVLAHDTSRIVQWLLKYSSDTVKDQISKEIIPVTLDMFQSKYGIFCAKRLLKYGNAKTKSQMIDKLSGNAVKLSSHTLSAPVFEYAYTTWASPTQKQFFTQEFFGDLYKNTKDAALKHLTDVFATTPDLKAATLNATKSNVVRVINKNLLDSALVQTVLHQLLTVCSTDDRAELISMLVPHIVVISNSKDGARVAMQCIWHGTNKDRKLAMKTLKEHALALAKHEHGHCTIITLLDTADDTVLLHKIILGEILKGARELAVSDWGRKVLLWLVAPAETTCFHPIFVKELETGRLNSTSKKQPETRREEILGYSIETLLDLIEKEPAFWLGTSSLAYEMLAILKAAKDKGAARKKTVESLVDVIVDTEWSVKVDGKDVKGVEDAGLHMVLKKLAKIDQELGEGEKEAGFGACLAKALTDDVIKNWIVLNRGCFLLLTLFENSPSETQDLIRKKMGGHKGLLKKQTTTGAKILLKKIQ